MVDINFKEWFNKENIYHETNKGILINDDCLHMLKQVPSKSINLIVIDPPYNIRKDKWDKIDNYIEWMGLVFKECERVLKDSSSFYWFHNDFEQMAELQHWLKKNTRFVFKSLITIDKLDNIAMKDLYGAQEHFRNYININEYICFYTFQDETGLEIVTQRTNYESIITKIQDSIKDSNLTKSDIIQLFLNEGRYTSEASAKVHASYKMGWNKGKRFDLMDEKLFNYLNKNIKWKFTYNELKNEYEILRNQYESLRYTFNKKEGLKNCWSYSFRENKQYKHKTQKPLQLIKDIITYSSNEGDIILDCFSGTGTLMQACEELNRQWICCEREKDYCNIHIKRLNNIDT